MRTTILCFMVLAIGCAKQAPIQTAADAEPKPVPVVEEMVPVEEPLIEEAQSLEVVESVTLPPPPEEIFDPEDVALAKRIFKWKVKYDHGIWHECGEKYAKEDIKPAALEWAAAINEAARKTEYQLRNGTYVRVDKREAIGIMISESRFDRCAIGPNPRTFAYKRKIIKRPPASISHSLDEIKQMVQHPQFGKRKVDLGPAQIVKSVWKMSWGEIEEFLTLVPGVQKVFDEMAYRGEFYNTRRPSLYWPGSRRSPWYKSQISRKASMVFPGLLERPL